MLASFFFSWCAALRLVSQRVALGVSGAFLGNTAIVGGTSNRALGSIDFVTRSARIRFLLFDKFLFSLSVSSSVYWASP